MAGKLTPKNKSKTTTIPGPGEYDTSSKLGGKHLFSKYKNTTNIIWSIDKSPRFEYKGNLILIEDKNKIPGPAKYDTLPLINPKGQVFISKFQSSPGKTMGARFGDGRSKFNSN